jgi:hypothetical protein
MPCGVRPARGRRGVALPPWRAARIFGPYITPLIQTSLEHFLVEAAPGACRQRVDGLLLHETAGARSHAVHEGLGEHHFVDDDSSAAYAVP